MEIGTGKDAIPDAIKVENPVIMEFTGSTTYDTAAITDDSSQETQTASSVAASLFTPAVGGVIGAWLMMWSLLA